MTTALEMLGLPVVAISRQAAIKLLRLPDATALSELEREVRIIQLLIVKLAEAAGATIDLKFT